MGVKTLLFSHSFRPILSNFMINIAAKSEYRLLLLLAICQTKTNYGTLKLLLTQDDMGLEISNATPTFFI